MTLVTDPVRGPKPPLPVGSIGALSAGYWGAWFLMISETMLFAYLFFAYFYYAIQPAAHWIPGPLPSFQYSGPQTALMVAGCITAWWADRVMTRDGTRLQPTIALSCNAVFAGAFTGSVFVEWFGDPTRPFMPGRSTYDSLWYLISGTHLVHVVLACLIFLIHAVWAALGAFDRTRHVGITISKLYWYFLTAWWLGVFFVLDISPYFFPPPFPHLPHP